jgi:hypothetical protein
MLDLLKLYRRNTSFRRCMEYTLETARLGLAKEYPRMKRVGNMKDSKTKDEESTLLTYTELCHS